MIRTEDDLRAAFESVTGPDTPPPGFETLRRRANRRRLQQAGAALTTVVVLAAGAIGGVALSRTGGTTINPADVTRTPAHIPGISQQQWLVGQRTIDGRTYQAASYRSGNRSCLVLDSSNWCEASHWPAGEVADAAVDTTNRPRVVAIVGRVPATARTVTVTYDAASASVSAVATPTSSAERFFVAFLKLPGYDFPGRPLIGVTDASGRAVAPVSAGGSPITPTDHSHFAGLPTNQTALSYGSDGHTDVIYRQGDQVCLDVFQGSGKIFGPSCIADSAPSGSQVLGAVHLPDKITDVIGAQPTWASTTIASAQSQEAASALHIPGINTMNFFVLQGNGGVAPYFIATCHPGDNCTTVRPFDPKNPTGG